MEPVAMNTLIIDAFQGMTTDIIELMTGLIPVGLSVFAVVITIAYAKKLFKKLANG